MGVDLYTAAFVFTGALFAGFTTGLAGFGTGLVAAGFWFHVLPAAVVPPLIALASVVGQWVGLMAVKRTFDWPRTWPYLIGGVVGVPFGVAALALTSPDILRLAVGVFLVIYAIIQFSGVTKRPINLPDDKRADGIVGVSGGFLGGFAGLSGTLPLVWLQLKGGPSGAQRAIYQPFNMIVLAICSVAMWASGLFPPGTWTMLGIAAPGIAIGAWIGARLSTGVSEEMFKRGVLTLLLVSGCLLSWRAWVHG